MLRCANGLNYEPATRYRIDRIGDNFFQELATFDTFLGLGERESGDEDGDAGSGSDSGADDGGGSTAKKVGGFLKSMFGKKAARAATAEKKEPDDFVKVGFLERGACDGGMLTATHCPGSHDQEGREGAHQGHAVPAYARPHVRWSWVGNSSLRCALTFAGSLGCALAVARCGR